jgi:prephenate dehydrogenase
MKRFAIVGLGLVGGSIALGLKQSDPACRIVGIDLPEVIDQPEAARFASELHPIDELEEALADIDLAVLCAPVLAIVELLPRVLGRVPLVTDCGSTKRAIVAAAAAAPRRDHFVPGHPMAGGPEGGFVRARGDLFAGRRWLLCAEGSAPEALAAVEAMVRSLGAEPVLVSAEQHDRSVALTSHLPQILASALKQLAGRRGDLALAGPSFEAATRAASGNERMWRDVFASNAAEIAQALDLLVAELESARRGLGADPPDLAPVLRLLGAPRPR